jgi:hypothetical protein
VIPEKSCVSKEPKYKQQTQEGQCRGWGSKHQGDTAEGVISKGDYTAWFNRRVATNIAVSLDFEPLSGRLLRVSTSHQIDNSLGRAFVILRARAIFLM